MMGEGPGWKQMLPLTIAVVIYLCVGAAIFSEIEGDPEIQRRIKLKRYLDDFLGNNTCIDSRTLHGILEEISSDIHFSLHTLANKTVYTQWDFTGAFSFVITVVTTIGYGNMAPRTGVGKIALVVYAVFGIPATMILLSFIGQLLVKLSTRVNRCKVCSEKPVMNKVLNMILIVSLGLTMLFGLPALVFSEVEKWDFLEGLYYCFVTLSTIGFGDYVAAISENRLSDRGAGDVYRVVTFIWILFGLSYLSLVINYISNVLILKAEKMEKLTKDRLELQEIIEITKNTITGYHDERYIDGSLAEVSRLQQELSKTKRSVYKTAVNVTSSVTGYMNWETPVGDAIDTSQDDKGVKLLSVCNLGETKNGDVIS